MGNCCRKKKRNVINPAPESISTKNKIAADKIDLSKLSLYSSMVPSEEAEIVNENSRKESLTNSKKNEEKENITDSEPAKPGENKFEMSDKVTHEKIKQKLSNLFQIREKPNWQKMGKDGELGSLTNFLKDKVPEDQLYFIETSYYCYIGELKNKKFDGFGKVYFPDKEYYKGYFKNGMYQGRGLRVKRNGRVHIGNFKKGDPLGIGRGVDAGGFYDEAYYRGEGKHGISLRYNSEGILVSSLKFVNGRAM